MLLLRWFLFVFEAAAACVLLSSSTAFDLLLEVGVSSQETLLESDHMVSENSTYITRSSFYRNTHTVAWFRNQRKEQKRLKANSNTVRRIWIITKQDNRMKRHWSVFCSEATVSEQYNLRGYLLFSNKFLSALQNRSTKWAIRHNCF